MPDSDNKNPVLPNDSQSTELRMRRALGLQGPARPAVQQRADQARPRHRFVQDGGVPVVVLNSRGDNDPTAPLKSRVAELEASLDAERTSHGATRRSLSEAQASIQALQTRLAHAEFAHSEALAAERQARRIAEDALQAPTPAPEAPAVTPPAPMPSPAVRKAPRKPRVASAREPQPVKWWLPSFREKKG